VSDPTVPSDPIEIAALLRARAAGPPPPGDLGPWDFLLRLPDELLAARVWPVVDDLLLDGDPRVRLYALEFVMTWRGGVERTLPRLVDVAEHHADRFADERVGGARLRERLQHAIANQARAPGRDCAQLTALLRRLDDGSLPSAGTATAFAALDPDYFTTVAVRLGDTPEEIAYRKSGAAAVALYQRDRILPLLGALAPRPREEKEQLLLAVLANLALDDDKVARIAHKNRLPPPAQPAPSEADCRAALGL
jgi:hypothetical protein